MDSFWHGVIPLSNADGVVVTAWLENVIKSLDIRYILKLFVSSQIYSLK